jgi:hypothetical protein
VSQKQKVGWEGLERGYQRRKGKVWFRRIRWRKERRREGGEKEGRREGRERVERVKGR